ncbi:MAG: hypothetical protein IPN79_15045 [Saprospiraceae bacterium]|nr:hypothetical protein [Saprospiraceae bacterium]
MGNESIVKLVKDRVSYINSLQLAAPTEADLREVFVRADETSANAVAGSTVSFVTGFPKLQKYDVLNSTLLAQLAANFAFDRESETEDWYRKYTEVLENLGWVLQGFSFAKYNSASANFTMDKVVLNVIAAIATGGQLAVVSATLKALSEAAGDDKALTLLDTNGSSGPAGNFQISAATIDNDLNVSMTLGAFYFKSTEHRTRFLFWSWSSTSVNMYYSAQAVTLNDQIYAMVRQAVIDKLGNNAQKYVADIQIGI